jgi:hypothetical protein
MNTHDAVLDQVAAEFKMPRSQLDAEILDFVGALFAKDNPTRCNSIPIFLHEYLTSAESLAQHAESVLAAVEGALAMNLIVQKIALKAIQTQEGR